MPRQARIDAQGAFQHIMVRGIERRQIFHDNRDRDAFVERLGRILKESATPCYGWTLMPNHVHLLLRTGQVSMATVMRRLLTGYAVTFNRRHRRHGQLFQNRDQSSLCQQAPAAGGRSERVLLLGGARPRLDYDRRCPYAWPHQAGNQYRGEARCADPNIPGHPVKGWVESYNFMDVPYFRTEVVKYIERALETCRRVNMPCGVHTFDVAGAKQWIQKGMRFMACGNEVTWLVDAGQKATAEIKEAVPR